MCNLPRRKKNTLQRYLYRYQTFEIMYPKELEFQSHTRKRKRLKPGATTAGTYLPGRDSAVLILVIPPCWRGWSQNKGWSSDGHNHTLIQNACSCMRFKPKSHARTSRKGHLLDDSEVLPSLSILNQSHFPLFSIVSLTGLLRTNLACQGAVRTKTRILTLQMERTQSCSQVQGNLHNIKRGSQNVAVQKNQQIDLKICSRMFTFLPIAYVVD